MYYRVLLFIPKLARFRTKNMMIKNIGIIAHIDAGKTTLTESILYNSGLKMIQGNIDKGTTTTDYLLEEKRRGITVQSAVVSTDWSYMDKHVKLNLFDTPGHSDFVFEVKKVLPALDFCIFLLDAAKGVEPQTKAIIRLANDYKMPMLCFINKTDKNDANFERCLKSMEKCKLVPLEVQNYISLDCIRDLISEECPNLYENIATHDDEFAEKYLDECVTKYDAILALQRIFYGNQAVPVLYGSAKLSIGILSLLNFVTLISNDQSTGLFKDDVSYAFKITNHPRFGEVTMFRNFALKRSGKQFSFYNYSKASKLKRSEIFSVQADSFLPITDLLHNQVYAMKGKMVIQTGDIIGLKQPIHVQDLERYQNALVPQSHAYSSAIETDTLKNRSKLVSALDILTREDPSISYIIDEDTDAIVLKGIGRLHLEISVSRLRNEHKIKGLTVMPVQIEYRELLLGSSKISKHEVYSGKDDKLCFEVEYDITQSSDLKIFNHGNVSIKGIKVGFSESNHFYEIRTREIAGWIKDAAVMACLVGPNVQSPVVGCNIKFSRVELRNGDKTAFESIEGIRFQRMVINSIRQSMKSLPFEVVEPQVEFEINLYSQSYKMEVLKVLNELECNISSEDSDLDKDLITIMGSCSATNGIQLDEKLRKRASGSAFLHISQ